MSARVSYLVDGVPVDVWAGRTERDLIDYEGDITPAGAERLRAKLEDLLNTFGRERMMEWAGLPHPFGPEGDIKRMLAA